MKSKYKSKKKKGNQNHKNHKNKNKSEKPNSRKSHNMDPAETPVKENAYLENGSSDEMICPHFKEAVKPKVLRKNIKKNLADVQCKKCVQQGGGVRETPDLTDGDNSLTEKEPTQPQIWLCLACCKLHCGRYDKEHASQHYNESKAHTIAMKLDEFDAWCYACDKSVTNSTNSKIKEARKIIGKALEPYNNNKASAHALTKNDIKTRYQTAAPGLSNLGNTCFFNSVMQVVVATSVLHDILEPDNPYQKPPLIEAERCPAAKAEEVGPLTDAFKDFLREVWGQQGGTVTPRELFSQIARKWQQFRGWRQQDSQELMRFMFDGIKCEESEFIKKSQSREEKEEELTREDDELIKEQDDDSSSEKSLQQKPEPFIDICFGGKLVSVIVCDTCKNESYSYEEFLDVSLPIISPFGEGNYIKSKYNSAKRMISSCFRNSDSTSPQESPNDDSSRSGDDDSSDEGLEDEDNNRDNNSEIVTISKDRRKRIKMLLREPMRSGRSTPNSTKDITLVDCLASFMKVETLDGENLFACENCWKSQNSSEEPSNNVANEDSMMEEQSNNISVETSDKIENHVETQDSSVTQFENDDNIYSASRATSQDDLFLSSETTPNNSINPTMVDVSQPLSSESAPMNDVSSDDQRSSSETTPEPLSSALIIASSNGHLLSETTPEPLSSVHIVNDTSLPSKNLPIDGEHSSDTSEDLNDPAADQLSSMNYTNNDLDTLSVDKVMSSTSFSKPSNKESQPQLQKYVLRKAYKRYLFDYLPPVLVFHLKRFQQVGGRFSVSMKKIDDFVGFEEEIDVQDFIVPPVSDEMDDDDDESGSESPSELRKTKYRLYGVVVHQGSLYNGHYISYVLSRNIVPMREQQGLSNLSDEEYKQVEKIAQEVGDEQRQWIYCSDSSVHAVNVDEVLKSMAYLLFYEQVQ